MASAQRNQPDPGDRDYSAAYKSELCTAPPPTNLSASRETEYSLRLSWDSVPGATTYRIVRYDGSGSRVGDLAEIGDGSDADSAPDTVYNHEDLRCGEEYFYRIKTSGDDTLYKGRYGSETTTYEASTRSCPEASISENVRIVDEGGTAGFIVTLDKSVSVDLDIGIRVSETGLHLTSSTPTVVTIFSGDTSAGLELVVQDDNALFLNKSISVVLQDGPTYNLNSQDLGAWTAAVTVRPYPGAPSLTSVTDASEDGVYKVSLDWDAVTGADVYRVERGFSSTGPWTTVNKITLFDQGAPRSLTPGGDYPFECDRTNYFVVSARGNGTDRVRVYGPRSRARRFDAPACRAPAPPNLTITGRTLTTISLSWSDVDDAANYRLETSTPGANRWTTVVDAAHGTTTHTVTGLACSDGTVMHYFRISANGDGDPYETVYGAPSDVRGPFETLACPVITITAVNDAIDEGEAATFTVSSAPAVPEAVTIPIAVVQTESYLADTPPTEVSFTEGETRISLSLATLRADIDGYGDSITVTLQGGENYNLGSPSIASVTIRPFTAAPSLASVTDASAGGVDKVRLNWDTVTGADVYRVERGFSSTGPWTTVGKITLFDQGAPRSLTPGGDYPFECSRTNFFVVSARGNGTTHVRGYGPQSAARRFEAPVCKAPTPPNLTVTGRTLTTISLSWSDVDDAANYRLETSTPGANRWTTVVDAAHGTTTHTVTGLACSDGTVMHYFRISANGDGDPYETVYGAPSDVRGPFETLACPVITITAVNDAIDEGEAATFTVSSAPAVPEAVTIPIAVVQTESYLADTPPTEVSFTEGETRISLSLATLRADIDGYGDSITVTLQGGENYNLGSPSIASVTIRPFTAAPSLASVTDASAGGVDKVRLNWDTVTGADVYRVERGFSSTGPWTTVGKITLFDQGAPRSLTPGGDYPFECSRTNFFVVSARGNGTTHAREYGPQSAARRFEAPVCKAPVPPNLTVTGRTLTTISLSWSDVDDAANYKLETSPTGANRWTTVVDAAHGTTTHTVTGLACSDGTVMHYFRISANGDGDPYQTVYGALSDVRGPFETLACPVITITAVTDAIDEGEAATFTVSSAPAVPEAVTIPIAVVQTESYLADTPPTEVSFTEGETRISLSLATLRADIDGHGDTVTVTLQGGESYSLGSPSVASVTIKPFTAAPTITSVTDASADIVNKVRLVWGAVGGADVYRVERAFSSTGPWTVVGKITPFDQVGSRSLTPGGDYPFECDRANYYVVSARGNGTTHAREYGPQSTPSRFDASVCQTPRPGQIVGTNITDSTALLSWSAVLDAAAYKIEKVMDGSSVWEDVVGGIDITTTTYTVTGLNCDTEYSFRVRAKGDGSPFMTSYSDFYAATAPIRTTACPVITIAAPTPAADLPFDTHRVFEGDDATFILTATPPFAAETVVAIDTDEVQAARIDGTAPVTVVFPASTDSVAATASVTLSIPTREHTLAQGRGAITVTLLETAGRYILGAATAATVTVEDDDLQAPTTPANVGVTVPAEALATARVGWTVATGVVRYEVQQFLPEESRWEDTDPLPTHLAAVHFSAPTDCGEYYRFRVRALGDGETRLAVYTAYSESSFTAPDCLAVPAPNNLAASNQGLMSIDLSWSPVTGAVEYKLEHRVKETNTWEEVLIDAPGVLPNAVTPTSTTNPSKTLSSLVCRTNYSVRVSARGNGRLYSSNFGDPTTDLETSTERSYTTCADRIPTFGSETISELRLTVDAAMTAVTLPEATGGDLPLTYSLDDLPAGLMFDADDRQITGTPTVTSCGASYIYTVTDADATDADTDTISFNIAVLSGENARPTFNNATVADWTYSVTTNSTALQLPQAVGGFGPLRYSIHPTGNTSGSLPAGLTFNANRLLIYGVPTSTAAATEYTFTVRNRTDCASTDSDSITFNISIPDAPSLPATPTSITGLSATADNDAGTITISWSANNYPGYQIRQYVSPRLLYPGLPRENYAVTCGGKLATICPADATSAVISGYSATGWYYILVSGHNGRSVSTASAYVSTGSVRLTAVSDPEPTFGTATVADMVLIEDTDMTPVTLPIANGGNGRLSYTITPALPTGLSFNPLTRAISGEPTATSTATTYTYTVTDSDATNPDTDTITFRIEVVDTEISINGLRSLVYEGESIAFTVTVTDVPSLGSYDLEVTAYGAANTTSSSTNSDIGFNSSCSDVAESDDVTAGAATHSESHTLHVCDSEYNGGIVTITLVDANDNTVAGDWIYLEARPITVAITSDKAFPTTTSTASDRQVTLTATVDGPQGVNLQWQEWSGGVWAAFDPPETTTTLQVDADSEEVGGETEYLRGTKKYRLQVNHVAVSSANSEPFYVTWDELDILSDLSVALSAAVEADSGYTSAQTGLIICMDIPTIDTFNGLLSQYSGATKLKMDDTCRSQSDAMFSRVESLSQSHLSTLKMGNAEYAAWLETPRGVNYEALAGNSKRLRLHAIFMSSDTTTQPGSLAAPYYGGVRGIRSPAPDPPLAPLLAQEAGLGCLPSGVSGRHLTLANKMRVLNCLVFETPHDFWVVGTNGKRPADQLMEEDIPKDQKRWDWLGFENWDCTFAPQGPVPSCLKHDVAYATLQKSAGPTAGSARNSELDQAWNPRNKALADAKFRADIAKYGCQDSTPPFVADNVCPPSALFPTNRAMAEDYWTAVANIGWPLYTHRGWPVTDQDLQHIIDTPEFIVCGDAGTQINTTQVPQIQIGQIRGLTFGFGTRTADLIASNGCVQDIMIESYEVEWRVYYDDGSVDVNTISRTDFHSTGHKEISIPLGFLQQFRGFFRFGVTKVEIATTKLYPYDDDIVYGAKEYVLPINREVYA